MAITPEHEISIMKHAALLGGLFETAGHISIAEKTRLRNLKSKGTVYRTTVNSIITFTDNREAKIYKFMEMFGGYVRPSSINASWKWCTESLKALKIAEAIYDYAPQRMSQLALIEALGRTDDLAERLVIAEKFKNLSRRTPVLSDYGALLSNPEFLAGVFEARGFLFYPKDSRGKIDKDNYRVMLDITHPILSEGIGQMFSNTPEFIDGMPRRLRLVKGQSVLFLNEILPYLVSDISDYDKQPLIYSSGGRNSSPAELVLSPGFSHLI